MVFKTSAAFLYCGFTTNATPSRPCHCHLDKLIVAGPFRGTLEIRLSLKVPARLADDCTRRVAELVELPVVSYVSLSPGRRRVEG